MLKNTLFIISNPENVYLDTNILILGGLEDEIVTPIHVDLIGYFVKWPPL